MLKSTWLGSSEPEVHAEPDEDDGEETNVDELLLALEKALDNENNED